MSIRIVTVTRSKATLVVVTFEAVEKGTLISSVNALLLEVVYWSVLVKAGTVYVLHRTVNYVTVSIPLS